MRSVSNLPIRQKLIVIQLLTACIVLVLASAIFVLEDIRDARETMVQRLDSTALIIGENSVSALTFLDSDAAGRVLASLAVEPHILHGCVYDESGQVFATYSRNGPFDFPAAGADGHFFGDQALVLFKQIRNNDGPVGTVYLHADMAQLRENIREFLFNVLLVLGFGLAVSVLLSVLFQKQISRPILHLTEAAKSVSQTGDYSGRVDRESSDEIGELCDEFNAMLGQIQDRDAELRQAQEVLERRVEERTLELSQANTALQTEIGERRQAQETIESINAELVVARDRALAASRAKTEFLANMSHEIRTPLNAILGYAQILRDAPELSPRYSTAVGTIETSGEHLLALINDILDISKIEAGRQEFNPTGFDLRHLVYGLAAMFEGRCRQQGLAWRVEENLTDEPVEGDEGKLRQVLINLLGNAVKFTAQGEVALRVFKQDGDRYCFEVVDTGTGIVPERQAAIFEPFQQEAEGISTGGSGLGLAIARRHVELMGGRLELDSSASKGARFYFTLALPPGRLSHKKKVALDWSRVQRLAEGVAVQALIVDDVDENRDILAQMLLAIGVKVDAVGSGAVALERVRVRRPDIVFMDIRMPGMDGSETRRSLVAEHGPHAMQIVAVTASAFEHQRQRLLDEGFDEFIDKPFRRERVYACLAGLLDIEFELAEVDRTEPGATQAADWDGLVLPPALYGALHDAVDTHSVTRLREHFTALGELGDAGRQLADHLRQLNQRYDMRAIKQVLDTVESE